jgi:myo-inositol-1(or 4)-monophosphatase
MTIAIPDIAIELRELATEAGSRAAELVRKGRSAGVSVAYSKTAITDIVTQVDRDSEQFLRALLESRRPDDGFVGEEFDPKPSRSGISWVVDPIDGTVNFLYGRAPYAISIAAIAGDPKGEWEPLAAAVINVPDQHVYSAARGHGAYRDGVRLAAGSTTDLAVTLVATGFSYLPPTRVKQVRVLERLMAEVRDIRCPGCASLELCAVAEGAVDAYYERGLKPWDYAAGTLIAREAGAVVRGWSDSRPAESFMIAGNLRLIDALQPKIQAWMTAEGLQPA